MQVSVIFFHSISHFDYRRQRFTTHVSSALITYRRPLATSQYLIPHSSPNTGGRPGENHPTTNTTRDCAHYFLDPLSWMRQELEQGKLDGRLECPKCHNNVGKYAWQGMQCSCSEWVVPGISLSKSRIDQVKKTPISEIRSPPGLPVSHPSNVHATRQNL